MLIALKIDFLKYFKLIGFFLITIMPAYSETWEFKVIYWQPPNQNVTVNSNNHTNILHFHFSFIMEIQCTAGVSAASILL